MIGNPIFVIKADKKRVLMQNVVLTTVGIGAIVGIVMFTSMFVDLEVFAEVGAALGVTISPGAVAAVFAVAGILALGIVVVLTLATAGAREFRFGDSELTIDESSLLVFRNKRIIPYLNIQRVRIGESGFISGLFGIATLVLDLSGMSYTTEMIPYVKEPGKTAAYIQKIVERSRMDQYMAEREQRRYDEIVGRL